MAVDEPLISRLEQLARLKLSESERHTLMGDLTKILSMVEKLEELDTEGVEPLMYVNNPANALRPDVVRGQTAREEALRNAPDADGVFFKVPKVINK